MLLGAAGEPGISAGDYGVRGAVEAEIEVSKALSKALGCQRPFVCRDLVHSLCQGAEGRDHGAAVAVS